jgi:intracellular sulfur oxidation DsrE/DsrF family protein
VHGHAGLAVSDNRNPDNKTANEIVDEIMANLVPGAIAIPAAVFELVRLQEKGYKLVVNH